MGLDGGTVVNSSAVLKASTAQRNTTSNDDGGVQSENEIALLEHKRRWSCCALSGKKFTTADAGVICCDQRGNLFLKEFILEFLIAKKKGTIPETPSVATTFLSGKFDHIKTMKHDVCVLKLRLSSSSSSSSTTTAQEDTTVITSILFSCSFLDLPPPSNPRAAPFYVRWKCGHIFSSSALSDLMKQEREDAKLEGNNSSSCSTNNNQHPNQQRVLKTCPVSKCEKFKEESVMIQLVAPLAESSGTRRDRE